MAIYALGSLEPEIHPDAYVHPDAVLIGAVILAAEASVWPGAVIRADESPIPIGARTSVQDGTIIHTTAVVQTTVGDDVVIGHAAHLEGCTIHDLALIGSGSIVLHGAVVESGSIVGANAVVTNGTRVPAGSMALGVPANIHDAGVDREMIRLNAENYVQRSRLYRKDLRRLD